MKKIITIFLVLTLTGICLCNDLTKSKEKNGMEPKIVEKEAFIIAGLEFKGNINGDNSGIGGLWDKFRPLKDTIKNQVNSKRVYGFDTWDENIQKTGEFRYIAAVEVKDETEIPEGMVHIKVPASKYAVFTYELSQMSDDMIREIYSKWFPKSGLKMSANYDFEYYDEHFDGNDEKSKVYFYIPVE